MDTAIAFRDALQAAYGPLDWLPIPDGAIHRFYAPNGKPGTCNAWYLLTTEGRPAGCFGSWHKSGMFTAGAGRLFGEV